MCKGGIAMHENRSCKIPTRSELALFSDTVIKLTDHRQKTASRSLYNKRS